MRYFILLLISFASVSSKGAHTLYLFPGQGSDHEIFSKMEFSDSFSLKHMELPTPRSGERMREYATRFISQIDTNQRYSLIGVSLGGMICSELADVLNPENVIVISSAKCSSELPGRYRFQRVFPLNKAIPASWYNGGALFLQPIVEPDRNQEKETFIRMLNRKDKTYMKRAVDMIVNWDKKSYNQKIVHIHGVSDHTIPIRNVKATMVIPEGSHMMALTRGQEIGRAIVEVLNQTSVSL